MGSRTIVLKSKTTEYDALQREITEFCFASGYSLDFREIVELTLKEAFVNAIRHGNCGKEELPVVVTFNDDVAGRLRVSVRDCGDGFRPEDLPDPTAVHLLHKTTGRGVYIIRSNAEIADARRDTSGFSLSILYTPF